LIEGCCKQGSYWTKGSSWFSWSYHFESFTVASMTWLTAMEYLCHKRPRICSTPYIEEEQTTQWSKEKVRKDKQRSTKHTHKTKDRVTRTPLKTRGDLRCSGRVSSFCSCNY
jgi:hypothetical protein